MDDNTDRAHQEIDSALLNAMAHTRPSGPKPVGVCHHCEEPLGAFLRWCDVRCRDTWEKYKDRNKKY